MVSKTFTQVMPRFVVLQSPPEAVATKMVDGSWGTASISWTRPPVTAGPMARAWRAWRWASEIGALSWAGNGSAQRKGTTKSGKSRMGKGANADMENLSSGGERGLWSLECYPVLRGPCKARVETEEGMLWGFGAGRRSVGGPMEKASSKGNSEVSGGPGKIPLTSGHGGPYIEASLAGGGKTICPWPIRLPGAPRGTVL